jgi:hypothetical protein
LDDGADWPSSVVYGLAAAAKRTTRQMMTIKYQRLEINAGTISAATSLAWPVGRIAFYE